MLRLFCGTRVLTAVMQEKRGNIMLTVTEKAVNALKEHFIDHNINLPIRIQIMHGCCKGDTLRFCLCNLQKNDLLFSFGDIIFVIDRDLSEQYGAIKVDFQEEYDCCPCSGRNGGFNITSEKFSQCCGSAGCCEVCSSRCQEQKDVAFISCDLADSH